MPPKAKRKQASSSKPTASEAPSAQGQQEAGPRPRNVVAGGAPRAEKPKRPLVHSLLVFPIIAIIGSCSISAWVYTRILNPLYGDTPTNLHLPKVAWGVTIAAGLLPGLSGWTTTGLLGAALCALPNSAYWAAAYTGSALKDPLFGPIVTHMVALAPVIYLSVSTVRQMILFFDRFSDEQTMTRYTILPASATTVLGFVPVWNDYIPKLLEHPAVSQFVKSEEQLVIILGVAMIAVWAISVPLRNVPADAPGKPSSAITWRIFIPVAAFGILAAALPRIPAPALSQQLSVPFTVPGSPVRILSSVQSLSGRIIVGESLPESDYNGSYPNELRYLRASHSILGGVWIGNKIASLDNTVPMLEDASGEPLGDSIYGTFIVQEAVRLISKKDRAIPESGEKALIIGLGAGSSATALMRHNVTTTIIEIDPAVYDAATQFFGLPPPPPERLFLADARTAVRKMMHERQAEGKGDLYDYVIHDLFSGGSVPPHLFTEEFWGELKTIMNPDGIVAVNYAGEINDASKSILLTLQKSFGQCRTFHESMRPISEEQLAEQFVNLVIFCSPSKKPLEFRATTNADFLGSYLRADLLERFQSAPGVPLEAITGDLGGQEYDKWILKDPAANLLALQKPSALQHWKLMRQVLPDIFWTTY